MKPFTLFIILFLSFSGKINSQVVSEMLLGKGSGSSIVETDDHDFILISNFDNAQIKVSKIDPSGNILWYKYFGPTTGSHPDNQAYEIIKINNGRFLITGRSESGIGGYNQVYSLMIDTSGNTLFESAFGISNSTGTCSAYDSISNVIYVAGYARINSSDIFIKRFNWNTGVVREDYYDFGQGETPNKIIVRGPDDIIVAGSTNSFYNTQYSNGFLMNIDSSGNTRWVNSYGGIYNDGFSDLKLANDGGFFILGNSSSQIGGPLTPWLVRTNSTGDTLWEKHYSFPPFISYASSFAFSTENKIWICGHCRNMGADKDQGLIMEVDTNGSVLFSGFFGDTLLENFNSIIVAENNNIYALGGRDSGSYVNEIYLVRLDSAGVIASVQNQDKENGFIAYPNPAADIINIKLTSEKILNNADISFYDIYNRRINAEFKLNSDYLQVDMPLNPGLYLLVISLKNKTYSIPVVKIIDK